MGKTAFVVIIPQPVHFDRILKSECTFHLNRFTFDNPQPIH
jgi:hypothetical protein